MERLTAAALKQVQPKRNQTQVHRTPS
jgi:hypothetical protein